MHKNKNCICCRNYNDFKLEKELLDAIHTGEAVLFVGSGVSTENEKVFPYTFYDEIKNDLDIPDEDNISFSNLMSKYETQKTRRDLIIKIRDRLDYVHSFPEIYRYATSFHEKLSTIPMIKEIVTTNWDTFFEDCCGATPFVTNEDMVFWDAPDRKVLKIHGSVNNLGSIVATKEDYKKCYRGLEKNLIGSQLKNILARKTLIFIGYSFRDEDFQKIYSFIDKSVGKYTKKRFIVTINTENGDRWKKLKLEPIYTDGEYFLEVVRIALEKECRLISLKSIPIFYYNLKIIKYFHDLTSSLFTKNYNPELVYCLSYQDGLIHAFEYFLKKTSSSYIYQLSNYYNSLKKYESFSKIKWSQKKWFDYAYTQGYITGMVSMVLLNENNKAKIPYFFNIFRNDVYYTSKQFKKSFSKNNKNKSILTEFNKLVEKFKLGNGIIPHHTCFLAPAESTERDSAEMALLITSESLTGDSDEA
jgi:hypothetical protein